MKDFSKPERAHSGDVFRFRGGYEGDRATPLPRHRYPRFGRIGAVVLVAAGVVWVIDRGTAGHVENDDIEPSSQRQPPLPGFPKPTRTADNNNRLNQLGVVANLEGTAIAYTAEADHLVSHGRFRTDLRLDQVAAVLKVGTESIADPRSPDEIDPDAELFRAQAGTLTQKSKGLSRNMRRQQSLEGRTPDAVYAEWVLTDYSFTLNRLQHPTDEEQTVLTAIVRAAEESLPKAGDQIRAVGVNRGELAPGRISLAGGLLPVETPQQGSEVISPVP
jgi:hypothetical protein